LALEQSIVSYCDRNALLHFLNFVRLHRATEHEWREADGRNLPVCPLLSHCPHTE
jgi:hypothetical protein